MTWDEVMDAFNKALETPEKCEIGFWAGLDGTFHDNWDNYNKDDDAITCTCGVSHDTENNNWTVTPWLFFADCPAVFKTSGSARQMFGFWMNWMENLFGDGVNEPMFEADWLAVKSNRSVLMVLFDQEGQRLKEALYKSEQGANNHDR